MASQIGKVAGKAAQNVAKSGHKDSVLQKGARRDPELYILLGIMSGAFGLAGYYFGRKPTSSTSEAAVAMSNTAMPWQVEGEKHEDAVFKYQYHPRGDRSQAPKNAPSALNTVIVPNVTLPKELHDMFNKWGKDGY
ncbi:hypothetical protein UCRPC4_g03782 [Phaeomoniella chlamydospora]|uniref:Uncharacterized protein n=1 Tax=Phaeomoniella chlamydospora TaxID=158046 RepID=A0A0G2EGJ0_PHACM|nr:hypothetical protein UCRPC4_g03782 [Phaeomoniella chlamydospora]